MLKNQGDTDKAKALYEEVIDGYTVQLGPEHTETAKVRGPNFLLSLCVRARRSLHTESVLPTVRRRC